MQLSVVSIAIPHSIKFTCSDIGKWSTQHNVWGLVLVWQGKGKSRGLPGVLGVKGVKAYVYKDCRQEGLAAHSTHLIAN